MMAFEADVIAHRVAEWRRCCADRPPTERIDYRELTTAAVYLWAKDRDGVWVRRLVERADLVSRRRVFTLQGLGTLNAEDVHRERPRDEGNGP